MSETLAQKIRFAEVVDCLEKAGLVLAKKGSIPDREIPGYTTDTRQLENGALFIAYRGVQFDAHVRVPELARQFPESVFIIEESRCYELMSDDNAILLVKDSREAWSYIAALRYGNPQEKLKMIGVTGTNGKTSAVWFVRQILKALGKPCMTLGTIGVFCGEEILPATHTTPDPDELFRSLAIALDRGLEFAAMEVSSHAIVQRRLGPIRCDAVAFTSFSRDHLDFHASMKEYFAAKWELFTRYRKSAAPAFLSTTVRQWIPKTSVKFEYYGPRDSTHAGDRGYFYAIEESRLDHSRLVLDTPAAQLGWDFGFGGDFVMDNFTAALALVEGLGLKAVFSGSLIRPVPGRFEPIPEASQRAIAVIVDYAHTPDALEKTLTKLKEMTVGKLWVVFGCGGDRDRGKRPLMGRIAEAIADVVVVTSDNPRTESPSHIIGQIVEGMNQKTVSIYEDRREAIAFACLMAEPGDSILIAGKGHEDYQIIGTTKYSFDDRLVAAQILRGDGGRP